MTINRINNKRTNKYIDEDEEQEENINNNNNNNNNEPVSNNSNNQLNIDDRPFIVNSNTETVLSINLNEFNSRNDLINYDQFLSLNNINSVNNINNNVNNNSNLTMPDITFITEAPANKIKRKTNTLNQKSPIKFTRNLLWFPLVACCLVVLMAIISGLSFVFLNYHIQQQQLLKNNKTYLIYINNNNSSISTFIDTSTSPTTSNLFVNKTLMNNNNLKETCGNPAVKPNLRQVRIIKGHDAVPHSWPWTVSIGYYGPKNIVAHACGGSLINKRTVVTATHCVVKESIYRLVGSPVPNSSLYGSVEAMMRIYIGINKRSTDINEKNTYFAIKILSVSNQK
jgi:hypothetical protein